jgi:hypothetical protein
MFNENFPVVDLSNSGMDAAALIGGFYEWDSEEAHIVDLGPEYSNALAISLYDTECSKTCILLRPDVTLAKLKKLVEQIEEAYKVRQQHVVDELVKASSEFEPEPEAALPDADEADGTMLSNEVVALLIQRISKLEMKTTAADETMRERVSKLEDIFEQIQSRIDGLVNSVTNLGDEVIDKDSLQHLVGNEVENQMDSKSWRDEISSALEDFDFRQAIESALEDFDFSDVVKSEVEDLNIPDSEEFGNAVRSIIDDTSIENEIERVVNAMDLSEKICEQIGRMDLEEKVLESIDGCTLKLRIQRTDSDGKLEVKISRC